MILSGSVTTTLLDKRMPTTKTKFVQALFAQIKSSGKERVVDEPFCFRILGYPEKESESQIQFHQQQWHASISNWPPNQIVSVASIFKNEFRNLTSTEGEGNNCKEESFG